MKKHWHILLILATLMVGCSRATTGAPTTSPTVAPAPTQQVSTSIYADVVVLPARSVQLRFRSLGLVDEVFVEVGDRVTEGRLLARLDTTYLELEVARQEAELRSAEANLALYEAARPTADLTVAYQNLAAAEAALNRAIAQRDDAYNDDRASQFDRNAADAAVEQTTALRDAALARIRALQTTVTEEELAIPRASVAEAEVALLAARQRLAEMEIKAPFDGTITAVLAQQGESVLVTDVAVEMADLSAFYLETQNLNQASLVSVEVGQPVTVWLSAFPEAPVQGTVTAIALSGTPLSNGDVIFPVRIVLEESDLPLRWGMTGLAEIHTQGAP